MKYLTKLVIKFTSFILLFNFYNMGNLTSALNTGEITVLRPVENIDSIKSALFDIEKIKDSLLTKEDIVNIKWKNYIKKRWFRKLAIAFSISTEIINEKRIIYDDIIIYDFTVRATSPLWRYVEASASCSSDERIFNHLNNDVRATSQTRATNRAISDLIGLWEVSFEEMNDDTYNSKQDDTGELNSENSIKSSEMISYKQKRFLIWLIESKYKDEHSRNILYKKIDELNKEEAREKIKMLLDEWVEINS